MQKEGRVVKMDPATGRIGVEIAGEGYILAEQIDAGPIAIGSMVSGPMDVMGTETWTENGPGTRHEVFIVAYGISFEALQQEFA